MVVLSFVYRLPPLLEAADTNSDAAIVGLQAMHILRGEFAWLLFGSTYQTSVDSLVAAAWFAVLGPTPFALMLSALVGHVVLTLLAYGTLARYVSKACAAWLVLPLIFCPAAVHGNALYPPRQAALTLVFAALFVLDGADRARGARTRAAAGGVLSVVACFADPYALIFLPLIGLHLVFAAWGGTRALGATAARVGAGVVGMVVGTMPLALLLSSPGSRHGETKLTMDVLAHNFAILREACLPWVLGTKVYAPLHEMDYVPWVAPPAVVAVQWLGVVALGGLLVVAAFAPRVPWAVRRIGLVGLVAVPLTVGGFLLSPMVMDHFSARYLVAMMLLLPFALAPAAYALTTRRFAWCVAPYLVSAAVGGWVAYAPATEGFAVRTNLSRDDEAMGARLRGLGVHVAMADYWVAYRETFVFREDPIVVPSHLAQDRYRPYREVFARGGEYAYLVDRWRSEESEVTIRERLELAGVRFERIEEGDLVAFVVRAPPGKTPGLASR
ncbi:hypothetical protein [Pendulispora albinea]|uniref:Glycosyltransferase RgtA/B/C/D-like domain-containing protein n=1 Tax=Pendulispora albinea TaxID=2741071 RepID=A0ABZ2MCC0_9BACT